MKVIFVKDVRNVGRANEIKEVSDGYAKNFLLPKGLAKVATEGAVNAIKTKKEEESKVIEELKKTALRIKDETRTNPLVLKIKTGSHGEIFGGIHEKDIEDALFSRGFINLKLEKLERPIKQIGRHEVAIKLGKGIGGSVVLEIQPLNK